MSTDGEGRFLIRVPVNEAWALTATNTGFRPITQQVSGADAAFLILSLSTWAQPACPTSNVSADANVLGICFLMADVETASHRGISIMLTALPFVRT